jgi:Na+/proline symporter
MMAEPTVLALSLAYLGLLFAVAYFGDRYARDWSASSVAPAVYGLSLAIYCTSWTFYGAVGRAATSGIDFILIYTGPALVVTVGYPMLRKMVRLAKQHNVTSIADFLASRYGKSRAVGVTATLFATVGVLPYIALQLQAVSSTFRTIAAPTPVAGSLPGVVHTDTSLIVAALMAVFTILFGVRNVQASEQHRGMMLASPSNRWSSSGVAHRRGRSCCSCCSADRPTCWRRSRACPPLPSVSPRGSPLTWW